MGESRVAAAEVGPGRSDSRATVELSSRQPTASRWQVPGWLDRSAAWAWRLLILAIGTYATVWLLGRLRIVLIPVLVALLLAALAAPMSSWLVERRVPRLLAAWLTLLVASGVVAGVVWLTVEGVGEQLVSDAQWEEVRSEVRTWLQEGPAGLTEAEVLRLEQRAEDAIVGGLTSIDSGRVRVAGELVGATFLSVVLFFFFVKDGPMLWGWIVDKVEPTRRRSVDSAGRAAFAALVGYTRGVAITGLIDGLAIGIALWAIGVPLVIPLAVLTFFGAFFPIVGATAAGMLATLVALVANGPGDAVLVALTVLAIQQLEGDLIMPLVMRSRVKLHPTVILIALAAGGALAGLTGAFVAVPIAAMIAAAGRSVRAERVGIPGTMHGP